MKMVAVLLNLALFAAPQAGAAGTPSAQVSFYEQALTVDLDPHAADDFLKDESVMKYLKERAPQTYGDLLRSALQLKDLRDLIASRNNDADGSVLNGALKTRLIDDSPDYFGFGDQPQKLVEWSLRYPPPDQDIQVVKKALWEWDEISTSEKLWLRAAGESQQSWESKSFSARQEASSRWANAVFDVLWKEVPASRAESEREKKVLDDISQGLNSARQAAFADYLTKANLYNEKFADLSHDSRILSAPALQAALQQTRKARTVDDQMAGLGRIFDNLGANDQALQALRPLSGAQKFSSDDQRMMLQKMLAGALLGEIGGAEIGRQVQQFYKTHPLVLEIGDASEGNFASFSEDTGVLTLSDEVLGEWLKTRRLTLRDLLVKPSLLHEFAELVAPAFIHESMHDAHFSYIKSRNLSDWYSQDEEAEAQAATALYVLERAGQPCKAGKPCYTNFLEKAQDDSHMVRMDMELAEELNSNPAEFSNLIATDYYPAVPSLEAAAADQMKDDGRDALKIAADAKSYAAYRSYHQSFMKRISVGLSQLKKNSPAAPAMEVPPPPKAASAGGL